LVNTADALVAGERYVPVLIPASMFLTPDPLSDRAAV